MNNTYIIRNNSVKETLDHIDAFLQKMDRFKGKYPRYKSSVIMKKEGDEWVTELNINNKDDKDNIKPF